MQGDYRNDTSLLHRTQRIGVYICTKWKQILLFLLPMLIVLTVLRRQQHTEVYTAVQIQGSGVRQNEKSSGPERMLPRESTTSGRREDSIMSSLSKYPDLTFLALSNATVTQDMSPAEAEYNFYRYVEHVDVDCTEYRRFGKVEDGGWDWCLVGPFAPKPKQCLVYSFGIGSEWSFDDAISNPKEYGCIDRAFDPTNGKKNHIRNTNIYFYDRGIGGRNTVDQLIAYNIKHHQMPLRTFADFREEFNETNVTLDYLKMDVEYSEWEAFKTILYNGDLRNVKQVGIEIHTNEVFANKKSSVKLLTEYYNVLKGIESLGFLKFQTHANMAATYKSKHTGKRRTCCYEMKWINLNVLTGDFPKESHISAQEHEFKPIGTPSDVEKQFESFIHRTHVNCREYKTFGKTTNEQWRICTSPESGWKTPCTVYSFGVTNATSFEREIKDNLRCEVQYKKVEERERLDVVKTLADTEKIDFLKIDLDHLEWDVLHSLLPSGHLAKVKQIGLEIHLEEFRGGMTIVSDYQRYHDTISKLEAMGFQKWFVQNSQYGMYDSPRTGDRTTNAFKLYYIRTPL